MSPPLFKRIAVPVAGRDDATSTASAVAPYVDADGGTVIAVHVIEKAGGAPDKASVAQRERYADDLFERVADGLADVDADLKTQYRYGTDVAGTIVEAAHDLDANAIVFTPRGGSRWLKLLAGDVTTPLVNESDLPVIVLSDQSGGIDR